MYARFRRLFHPAATVTLASLAMALSVHVVLAADLSIGLGPGGPSIVCDALDACAGSLTGNLSGPAQSGTYQLQLALDAPADISGAQVCFTPTAGATNVAQLTFTTSSAPGQLLLSTASLCLPTDVSAESGAFSIPFTVQSGTDSYVGAHGSGVLSGQFAGSVLGGSTLTFLNVASSDFTVPVANPCPDPSVCDGSGPPSPGATPELDSLVLFGSALTGIAAYVLRRRRAGLRH